MSKQVFHGLYGGDLQTVVDEWLGENLPAYNGYEISVIVEVVEPEIPRIAELNRRIEAAHPTPQDTKNERK